MADTEVHTDDPQALRSLIFMLYRTLTDRPVKDLAWLTDGHRKLLRDVIRDLSVLDPDADRTSGDLDDALTRAAERGADLTDDVLYVDLTLAQMARVTAVDAALAPLRCRRCGGTGQTFSPVGQATSECIDCAGSGVDPDATLADKAAHG